MARVGGTHLAIPARSARQLGCCGSARIHITQILQATQALVRGIFQVNWQLVFGLQVVVGEDIQISLQGLRGQRLSGQVQTQSCNL